MSAGHDSGRRADRLRGPLRSLSAPVKLVWLVAFLVGVGLTPNARLAVLGLLLVVATLAAALAFVEGRALLRRLTLDLPLVVLATVQALLGHGPHREVLGLRLSEPGLELGLGLLAKATIGVVAVSAVAASTTVPETIDGLRRLGLPGWFCRMVSLAARQVDLLRSELERLRLATLLRHPGAGRRGAWAVAGRSLGALLVRSTERADRLQLAAELRGGPSADAHQ